MKRMLAAMTVLLAGAALHAQAQDPISLSGTVTVAGGSALPDVRVWLMMQDELATTDALGHYSMESVTGVHRDAGGPARALDARVQDGRLVMRLSEPQQVTVGVYDGSGRRLYRAVDERLGPGEYRIGLGLPQSGAGLRLVRVQAGSDERVFRLPALSAGAGSGPQSAVVTPVALRKAAAAGVDTLVFTALGHQQVILPIDSLIGVYDAAMQAGSPPSALLGMRRLDGDTFTMGGTGSGAFATPVHDVVVSGFYIDTTEVTQARYMAVMGISPPVARGFSYDHNLPVESVTWFDAALFCNRQSLIDGRDTVYSYTTVTGTPGYGCTDLAGITIDHARNGYRLPTEAQWEYACRAGTTGSYYWGPADSVDAYAWYADNSSAMSHPVAGKRPNAFGLYDMNGNVWEWSNDWYGTYPGTLQVDPTGAPVPGTQRSRVVRGGSQDNDTTNITSYMRQIWFHPETRFMTIGFRSVRPLN